LVAISQAEAALTKTSFASSMIALRAAAESARSSVSHQMKVCVSSRMRSAYRLRVGDWRVIYDLDNGLRILSVERIAPRGGAYE
jgi:mRNA-degrading endonuclease RelE of RelBE toxin-antitoxin system